ncbi:sugar transferase [Maribacter luteus]|uniref:Sugar transferase n=1 Tax=Maribacter luteus TaxID=2594478 RepID=A0A6I2MLD2_9FLAO|nr:sugar transferase [Maribacter luteus]MRX63330.1 sugar transferase [Maribacter luteus]
MEKSPILLFTYKRLEALKNTIGALQKNNLAESSELYIFSDGPKSEKDAERIGEVRAFLKTIRGFKAVHISESMVNKGLANSIIDGVSQILKTSETVIVLEDDLLTTPNFLKYMNDALAYYKTVGKAFSISGYSFDLRCSEDPQHSTYFLNRGWSWGWATWRDRWEKVDWEVSDYSSFARDKKLQKKFAEGGSDLNKMLREQMTGQLDSWAIRWFYHQFKVGGVTLYPLGSKVYNNGFDEFATHTSGSDKRYVPYLDTTHKMDFIFPEAAEIHPEYQRMFNKKMGIISRVRSKIGTILKKLGI